MSLNRLLRTLAVLSALATLALVGRLAPAEWSALEHARAGVEATEHLKRALVATEMASRERGPANGLLGEALPHTSARLALLAEARARTDLALDALLAVLGTDRNYLGYTLSAQMNAARTALIAARRSIDKTASKALDDRSPDEIRSAVYAMVSVVPMLAPITSAQANKVQLNLPSLGGDANGAQLLSELREHAGLLGSHFTAALAREQPFSREDRAAINRTRGRIDGLRTLVDLYVRVPGQAPSVLQAWEAAEQQYFGSAQTLVTKILTAGDSEGRFGIDAASFAAIYVPDMDTFFTLRDDLLALTHDRAVGEHQRAKLMLVVVLASAMSLIAVLAATIFLLHRRVLQPLTLATQALRAMADNQLNAALPRPRVDDEMAAVIHAVRQLQERSIERNALEEERNGLIQKLSEQSNTDFLTGLANRRAFFVTAERVLADAGRNHTSMALAVLDVDHFKRFNDTRGHAAGDEALVIVARAIRDAVRGTGMVARLGGEEFAILFADCEPEQAVQLADRVRNDIFKLSIMSPTSDCLCVTASLGVAHSADCGYELKEVLARADEAMYCAKAGGRNRVMLAEVSKVR